MRSEKLPVLVVLLLAGCGRGEAPDHAPATSVSEPAVSGPAREAEHPAQDLRATGDRNLQDARTPGAGRTETPDSPGPAATPATAHAETAVEKPDQEATAAKPGPPPARPATDHSGPTTTGGTERPREEPAARVVPEPAGEARGTTAATAGATLEADEPAAERKASQTEGDPPPFVLRVESESGGPKLDLSLDGLDPTKECDLSGEAIAGTTRFAAKRHAPSLLIQQSVEPAPEGTPGFSALRVDIKTAGYPKETRWLVSGSRHLGRLYLRAAFVECIGDPSPRVLEALEKRLKETYSAGPKVLLEVKKDERHHVLPVRVGEKQSTDSGCEVEFLRLFQCYAIDMKTGEPIDQSPRPLNPAVEVRLTHGDRTRTALLFSRVPGFSRNAEDEDTGLRFVYPVEGHPHPRANVTIVDSTEGKFRVFAGIGTTLHKSETPLGGTALFPGLEIKIAERTSRARVAQAVKVDPRGRPGVLLGWAEGTAKGERWVLLDAIEEIRIDERVYLAHLRRRGAKPRKSSPRPPGLPAGHPTVLPRGHPAIPQSQPGSPEEKTGAPKER